MKNESIIENEVIDIEENNPFFCVEEDTLFEFQGEVFFDSFSDISIPRKGHVVLFAERIIKNETDKYLYGYYFMYCFGGLWIKSKIF